MVNFTTTSTTNLSVVLDRGNGYKVLLLQNNEQNSTFNNLYSLTIILNLQEWHMKKE